MENQLPPAALCDFDRCLMYRPAGPGRSAIAVCQQPGVEMARFVRPKRFLRGAFAVVGAAATFLALLLLMLGCLMGINQLHPAALQHPHWTAEAIGLVLVLVVPGVAAMWAAYTIYPRHWLVLRDPDKRRPELLDVKQVVRFRLNTWHYAVMDLSSGLWR